MIKGSIVALVTPFLDNKEINFNELARLIEYHIANGTSAILILGTTGESSTLSKQEKIDMAKFSYDVINKRIPLVIGVGTNDTNSSVEMAKILSQYADYLLVITPYYNKANNTGLIKHFTKIAEASTCPIILYNVPSRTGMSIPILALKTLAMHPKIVGIKEASGDINYASEVARLLSPTFYMYSGNDDIIVPLMSLGAVGVISVLANIAPNYTSELVSHALKGEYPIATSMQISARDLIKALFLEVNPIPIKHAMNMLGFNVGGYRLPLDELSKENRDRLNEIISKNRGIIR